MEKLLCPSMMCANFGHLETEVKELVDAGIDIFHLDIMDGSFVPSISFGFPIMQSIRGCTERMFDVHLMIEEPIRYIAEFAKAGADIITVHAEACKHLDRTIEVIKEQGLLAGVALALSGLLKNIFMVWVSVFVLNYLYESLVGIVCKNGAATYYPLTYAHQVAPLGEMELSVMVTLMILLLGITIIGMCWGAKRHELD